MRILIREPSNSWFSTIRPLGRGFTLVELLVVLVLLSVMGAFVGPNMWKQYARASERAEIEVIHEALLRERKLAYTSGQPFTVDSSFVPLRRAIPEGWELLASEPIYFLPSGVTSGGSINLLSTSGNKWQLVLSPLDGKAKIERL
jgi:prepilin-type N-terminal cleavage/methylation domain-containing protein